MLRLRQVALVAEKMAPVVDTTCDTFAVNVCYNDPGIITFGLENALMAFGDTFLEVVAPVQDNTTAGRLLERRKGDGGYMVILQSDNFEADRKHIESLGIRLVWDSHAEDGGTIHLHPKDVGGAILSFDWMKPQETWKWAGTAWREHIKTDVSAEIIGAEVQAADPAGMSARWGEVCQRRVEKQTDGSFLIPLTDSFLRFVEAQDGRGDGVSGVAIRMNDKAKALANAAAQNLTVEGEVIHLGGVKFYLA